MRILGFILPQTLDFNQWYNAGIYFDKSNEWKRFGHNCLFLWKDKQRFWDTINNP